MAPRRPALPVCTLLTAVLATAIVLTGCSPTIASLQPARLTPEGHLSMTTGIQLGLSNDALDQGFARVRQVRFSDGLSDDELTAMTHATTLAFTQAAGPTTLVSVAYGLSRSFELSLRGTTNSVRAGVRYQLLRLRPGFYAALGLGLTTQRLGYPISQFTSAVEQRGFHREDFDASLMFGFSSRVVHAWLGPKLIAGQYAASLSLCMSQSDGVCTSRGDVAIDGSAIYLAGQAGLAIGYKRFWFVVELTVARVFMNADAALDAPEMHASRHDEPTMTSIVPAIGVHAWF